MREVVKKIGFSFYPEDLENLEAIAKDIGMSKTEVMRQLIKKAVGDKKTREIIAKNSFWEKVNKQKKLSSYNGHYEKDASNHMDAPTVSSNSHSNYSEFYEEYTTLMCRYVSHQKVVEDMCSRGYAIKYPELNQWLDKAWIDWDNEQEEISKTLEIAKTRWVNQ